MLDKPAHDAHDVLLRESEEFQQLCEHHQELDRRLSALTGKLLLSEVEKTEATNLKKRKLAIKDRMATMLRSH